MEVENGNGEDFPAFNPDSEGTKTGGQSAAELAGEFETLRRQSLKAIETLAEADLKRGARHQELGPVSLQEMLSIK
jgi:DinB superfamily